ncbi:hypothetical protein EZV62_004623 [Acer yangbiense]|uniref:AAA+ ATPase domain-containing protein n=1 Tax=Acer yangbiense TaxID=1000413 RepID=A0A5C7IKF9_9ROSI|nr:hypothetical protein EZV62_004623 [Acer yangbiense]
MAEALIIFFLNKLEDQLRQEGELLSGFEQDIEWIKSELQAMVAFLKDVDRQGRDENVRAWVGELRSLVYDAEDIIDGFVTRRSTLGWNPVKHLRIRHQVISQIRRLKNKVIEVKERKDRYGFHVIQEEAPGTTSICSTSRGLSVGAATPLIQVNDIVGIDNDVEQLTELTLEGRLHQQKAISVFGMGGLGKTTVVKEVYKRVKTRFDCYSWVSMSSSHNLMDVIRNVLLRFKASKGEPAMDSMDAIYEGQLQEITCHYLQDENYLLVLDDIWEAELWEGLKHALPRDRGSVIITTRIKDIASSIEDNCSVYELQPFSDELAWAFFCRKAFRHQGTWPGHLKEFAEAIVRKCEGLPLAIVALAGLLSSQGRKNHLPFYLEYCFLHISLFPEDYKIGRKRLIRMCIAEGFVQKAIGKTEEEVGNRYFKQLMYRSMIQAITLHARDVVKACKVHNLMREVATQMFKEEKFGAILVDRGEEIEDRHRRLSVYNNAENIPTNVGKLNICSFHLFSATEVSCSALRKLLAELMLARMLNLQGVRIESIPEEVGNLIHLRYLDLRGTMIKDLPKSLINLRNLQTLDIRNTKIKVLPRGINLLRQLRHLLMPVGEDPFPVLQRLPNLVVLTLASSTFICSDKAFITSQATALQSLTLSGMFEHFSHANGHWTF